MLTRCLASRFGSPAPAAGAAAAVAVAAAALSIGVALAGCERPPVEVAVPPIRIQSEVIGSGMRVRPDFIACIAYSLRFPDGRLLMEDDETCLTVGEENVIDGLRRTLDGMRVGGRRVAVLPPHTHWGSAGHGPVPRDTMLQLEVEVLALHPPGWRPGHEPAGTMFVEVP